MEEIAEKIDGEGKYLYSEEEIPEKEDLPKQIDPFLDRAESARREKRRIWQEESKRAELIEKADEYLQKVDSLARCPVCGNSASKEEISEHLRSHSKTLSEKAQRTKELKEVVREAERDREQVKSDLEKLREARPEGYLQLQAKLVDLEKR